MSHKSYRIELELDGNWAGTVWNWSVHINKGNMVWHGTNEYKWTARRAAQKAARKHAKGLRQPKATDSGHVAYYYTPGGRH